MNSYGIIEENSFINGVIDFKELPLMSKNKANLALIYISRNPYGITEIGNELKNDKDFLLNVFSLIYSSESILQIYLEELPSSLKKDKEFLKELIKIDPVILISLKNNELYENNEIWKLALEKQGLLLSYAPKNIVNNIDLVKYAILNKSNSYVYIGEELKNNIELAIFTVNSDKYAINLIPEHFLENKDFIDGIKNIFEDKIETLNLMIEVEPKLGILYDSINKNERKKELHKTLINKDEIKKIKKKI